ncbi:DUF4148 domain-containing protein [Caenimonas koreensis]|uniref:DUF4148 domain-containing protein n=1 Tax=Caenimonas koreensis DSM 17982 TaxID=1121255 RepID=A0A844AX05_9BURK|nr:DUF4148 domain-containing protein [Caenimonas koreensis]MRD48905.1 DUF4148 domain-containing protein [Caenimonas koreensis DSM 17982]
MNTTTRFIAISAITALTSLAAHANGEGDNAPENVRAPVVSTVSVAQVKAEARMPLKITEGGTGYMNAAKSDLSRDAVRAQALMASRNGTTSRGELGSM